MNLTTLLKILVILFLSFMFSGCVTDIKPDNSNVYVWAVAYPQRYVNSGSTTYNLYCRLMDKNSPEDQGDFTGATVTVNGEIYDIVQSTPSLYWNVNIPMTLQEGDIITLSFKHDSFGSADASAKVPSALTDFTVSPSFPAAGVENSSNSYTISWSNVNDENEYLPLVDLYSGGEYVKTKGFYTENKYYTVNTADASNMPYNFLYMIVETVNKAEFPGFDPDSAFRIRSTYAPHISNRN